MAFTTYRSACNALDARPTHLGHPERLPDWHLAAGVGPAEWMLVKKRSIKTLRIFPCPLKGIKLTFDLIFYIRKFKLRVTTELVS